MKLTSFQLEQHLAKNLAPVYIVSGEELLLKQDALQLIRKKAKQEGFLDRTRLSPEAGFDWDHLYTLLYSNSMLAEKQLIELDFRDANPNKTASGILQEYANNPSPNHLLLIDIGKIDDKISKSAWYKAIEKIAAVIPIWPLPREQLPQWIMQRAKKYKLTFHVDAANLLADYIEGNLVAAAQSIEKLYLLHPDQAIDKALIEKIITDESRFTVFDFIEHLIAGNKTRSLHILDILQQDGIEPTLILWSITRELRLLSDMAQQLKQGLTFDALFQKNRIFARRQTAIRHFLKKFSAEDCWELLSHTIEIDRVMKGAAIGHIWDSFRVFCLRVV